MKTLPDPITQEWIDFILSMPIPRYSDKSTLLLAMLMLVKTGTAK